MDTKGRRQSDNITDQRPDYQGYNTPTVAQKASAGSRWGQNFGASTNTTRLSMEAYTENARTQKRMDSADPADVGFNIKKPAPKPLQKQGRTRWPSGDPTDSDQNGGFGPIRKK